MGSEKQMAPALRAGACLLVDRPHDGGLFILVGDDVDHILFVGQTHAEEFFSPRAGPGALGVQHRAAARARGARRVHDKVGIALVQNDDDQLVFKFHMRRHLLFSVRSVR